MAHSHVAAQKEAQGVEQYDLSFEGMQINQHPLVYRGWNLEQGTSAYLCIISFLMFKLHEKNSKEMEKLQKTFLH